MLHINVYLFFSHEKAVQLFNLTEHVINAVWSLKQGTV